MVDPVKASSVYAQRQEAYDRAVEEGRVTRSGMLEASASHATLIPTTEPIPEQTDVLFGTNQGVLVSLFPKLEAEAMQRRRTSSGTPSLGRIQWREAGKEKLIDHLNSLPEEQRTQAEAPIRHVVAMIDKTVQDDAFRLEVLSYQGSLLQA